MGKREKGERDKIYGLALTFYPFPPIFYTDLTCPRCSLMSFSRPNCLTR